MRATTTACDNAQKAARLSHQENPLPAFFGEIGDLEDRFGSVCSAREALDASIARLGSSANTPAISASEERALASAIAGTALRQHSRKRRYALARTAASIVGTQRAVSCGRALSGGDVQLFKSANSEGVHFRGIQTCGSVWACPVCAEKIARLREAELSEGIENWKGQTFGVTLTFSHGRDDVLVETLRKQAAARSHLTASRGYKDWRAQLGTTLRHGGGFVRALEVTHAAPGSRNANGWHPHVHEAHFTKRTNVTREEIAEFEVALGKLWRVACRRAGLAAPSAKRGVVVSLDSSATYVSKWGLAPELTRVDMKTGNSLRMNPWQLLVVAHERDRHSKQAAGLFREYTEAFKGRRQLVYSRDLKMLLGIDDKNDAEAADAEALASETAQNYVMTIGELDWFTVVACEAQANVLTAYEAGGAADVERLLERLRSRCDGYDWLRPKPRHVDVN